LYRESIIVDKLLILLSNFIFYILYVRFRRFQRNGRQGDDLMGAAKMGFVPKLGRLPPAHRNQEYRI
jgi:hypothetical protein